MDQLHQALSNIGRREIKDDHRREIFLSYCKLDGIEGNFALAALVTTELPDQYSNYFNSLIERAYSQQERLTEQAVAKVVDSSAFELEQAHKNLDQVLAREHALIVEHRKQWQDIQEQWQSIHDGLCSVNEKLAELSGYNESLISEAKENGDKLL